MKFTKRELPKHEGNGSSNYLKVEDGKSIQGVFRGEVHEFYQSWPQGGQKMIFDVPTAGASARFKINFVCQDDGKLQAKVWEFGVSVYNQLAELSENFDLEKTKVKITRRGTGKNTQWMIIPLGPAEAKGLKLIEAVPLNVLNGQQSAPSQENKADEEPPF